MAGERPLADAKRDDVELETRLRLGVADVAAIILRYGAADDVFAVHGGLTVEPPRIRERAHVTKETSTGGWLAHRPDRIRP